MKNQNKQLALSALAILCLSSFASPAQARDMFAAPAVQATIQNNFAVEQQQLRCQIQSDLNAGALSPGMAAGLTSQLNEINMQEQQILGTGGMINNAQNNALITQFNSVSQQLASAGVGALPVAAQCAPAYALPVQAYLAASPVATGMPVAFHLQGGFERRQPQRVIERRQQPAPPQRLAHNPEARQAFNRPALPQAGRRRG